MIGVQHFFMMTNDCEAAEYKASYSVLQPYIVRGVASLSKDYRCANQFQGKAYLRTYDYIVANRISRW